METDLYVVSFVNAEGKKDFISYGERGKKNTQIIHKVSRIRMTLTVA